MPAEPLGRRQEPDVFMAGLLRQTVEEAEASRPGSLTILTRLSELLYLELLRSYAQRLPAGRTGWLAAVAHAEIGQALRLLHAEPGREWTVDALAHEVCMSGSALARRFRQVVGEAPMQYLRGWRMQIAQQLLSTTSLGIAQVAARVGYRAPRAFHRAFLRHVGETPGAWRDGARAGTPQAPAGMPQPRAGW